MASADRNHLSNLNAHWSSELTNLSLYSDWGGMSSIRELQRCIGHNLIPKLAEVCDERASGLRKQNRSIPKPKVKCFEMVHPNKHWGSVQSDIKNWFWQRLSDLSFNKGTKKGKARLPNSICECGTLHTSNSDPNWHMQSRTWERGQPEGDRNCYCLETLRFQWMNIQHHSGLKSS